MARQVQLRRGTATQHNTFTGAEGEVTVDTTNEVLRIHDGITVGGFPTVGTGVVQVFTAAQRSNVFVLTDSANITPNFANSNMFMVTLGGNRVMANAINVVAGQSGSIFVVQDGTGNRTLSFSSMYRFSGAVAPTLSTTANAVDRIDYVTKSNTEIHCVFTSNY